MKKERKARPKKDTTRRRPQRDARRKLPVPEPVLDPQPIEIETYRRMLDGPIEFVGGYVASPDQRARLLQVLLVNVGLRRVVELAPRELWEAALRDSRSSVSRIEQGAKGARRPLEDGDDLLDAIFLNRASDAQAGVEQAARKATEFGFSERRWTRDEIHKLAKIGVLGQGDELVAGRLTVRGADDAPWRCGYAQFRAMQRGGIFKAKEETLLVDGVVFSRARRQGPDPCT
jgi:hypothetical protein